MTSILVNVSARRITLALHQLDLPGVHPDSAARCIKSIINNKSGLCCLLETDPAVAIVLINLCRQNNIELSFENLDFQQLINEIPTHKLLKAFFGLKTFDIENLHSQLPIAQINVSSAGRAFAAKLIAGKTGRANESLSFLAGLLADIGLLALAELFPKSLSALLHESKGDNAVLLQLEKENLGITHNLVSRQLAQKWRLPQAIADTVWLYCIGEADKLNNLANSEIILTVRLADAIVRDGEATEIGAKLSLTEQDINEIKEKAKNFISEINAAMQVPQKFDAEAIKQVCISLLEDSAEQKFTDFLAAISSTLSPASSVMDIAGTICSLICRILKAEKAGIALADGKQYETITAVGDKLQFFTFDNAPSAGDVDFDAQSTKSVKLEISGSATGSMLLQIPADSLLTNVSLLNKVNLFIAQLIAIKLAGQHDQEIAQAVIGYAQTPEQLSHPHQPAPQPRNDLSEIVAEIAAGAAHELNNPLAVVSGRAQLLAQRETDEAKKQILNQIIEKIKDAHEIVGQLMSYARPAKPQTRAVSPFIMVNNCLEKITARYMSEPLEIRLENIENLSDIEVDPEQVAEAIAQIIYNSLESYESGNGPVQISGSEKKEQNLIEISIKDIGCGMNAETLKKAAEPFFSDKSAGRQRGMGLSVASSLLKNNNCDMSIQSQLDKGTTVTILLPKSGKSENS
jgi:signal transduction histidine kinase